MPSELNSKANLHTGMRLDNKGMLLFLHGILIINI